MHVDGDDNDRHGNDVLAYGAEQLPLPLPLASHITTAYTGQGGTAQGSSDAITRGGWNHANASTTPPVPSQITSVAATVDRDNSQISVGDGGAEANFRPLELGSVDLSEARPEATSAFALDFRFDNWSNMNFIAGGAIFCDQDLLDLLSPFQVRLPELGEFRPKLIAPVLISVYHSRLKTLH